MSDSAEVISNYWDKLIGQALVSLAGASDDELRVQLYDVLDEFFDGSNCWAETLDVMVIPDTLDYQVIPLSGRILRLNVVIDQNGVPQSAIMPDIGTIHFLYPSSQTQKMVAVVIKTVTDPLQCFPPFIPDWILPTHGRVIFAGVLGYMMMQPGMSYSNPQLGQFWLKKFGDGISKAYVASSKSNKIGVQPWAFPQSYRTYGQKGGVSTFNVHPSPRR
jgi:hypothetical protein